MSIRLNLANFCDAPEKYINSARISGTWTIPVVRLFDDATVAAVMDLRTYVAVDHRVLDFWNDLPSDAGARVALVSMNIDFTGVATPHQRTVIYNKPRG